MKKTTLRKYASLAVRVGANVQKKQGLMIYASTEANEFVRMLVEEGYRAGAKWVEVVWSDQPVTKLAYRHETITTLSTVPEWMLERQRFINAELPAELYVFSDDPDGLSGISGKKFAEVRKRTGAIVKPIRDLRDNKNQWAIVAVPSVKWAKKVFPGMRGSTAVEKLWQAILTSSRVDDESDAQANWAEHNAVLESRARKLTEFDLDYVQFKSKSTGTDLKVWLIEGGSWLGGTEMTESGIVFNPNIPTEEVFTSPIAGRAEGRAVATKPLSINGQMIEDFSITFKGGRAVSCEAKKGEDTLRELIATDEGASRLGEVSLIGQSSPINQSGILFYETLFDENASCHIALGRGFCNVLPNCAELTREEWGERGLNDSMIHTDFMIGAPDMTVTGVKRDGTKVAIFKKGDFVI